MITTSSFVWSNLIEKDIPNEGKVIIDEEMWRKYTSVSLIQVKGNGGVVVAEVKELSTIISVIKKV